jgi:tRNA 2-thiouridine synthesizing protein A
MNPSEGSHHRDVDDVYDAAEMGCGELVLVLRKRLLGLAPGAVLRVRATDPGAPEDLPAWCRLTHHTLLEQRHPFYWIRRRPDEEPASTRRTET